MRLFLDEENELGSVIVVYPSPCWDFPVFGAIGHLLEGMLQKEVVVCESWTRYFQCLFKLLRYNTTNVGNVSLPLFSMYAFYSMLNDQMFWII